MKGLYDVPFLDLSEVKKRSKKNQKHRPVGVVDKGSDKLVNDSKQSHQVSVREKRRLTDISPDIDPKQTKMDMYPKKLRPNFHRLGSSL